MHKIFLKKFLFSISYKIYRASLANRCKSGPGCTYLHNMTKHKTAYRQTRNVCVIHHNIKRYYYKVLLILLLQRLRCKFGRVITASIRVRRVNTIINIIIMIIVVVVVVIISLLKMVICIILYPNRFTRHTTACTCAPCLMFIYTDPGNRLFAKSIHTYAGRRQRVGTVEKR